MTVMPNQLSLAARYRNAKDDADEALDLAVMEDLKREADLPKRTDAQQRIYDRIMQEDPYGHEHRFVMGGRS